MHPSKTIERIEEKAVCAASEILINYRLFAVSFLHVKLALLLIAGTLLRRSLFALPFLL